jgi:SAM-dependent methyltransferase
MRHWSRRRLLDSFAVTIVLLLASNHVRQGAVLGLLLPIPRERYGRIGRGLFVESWRGTGPIHIHPYAISDDYVTHITEQIDPVESFIAHVQASMQSTTANSNSTFVSFTVRGPSKKALAGISNDDTRGCLRLATGRLVSVQNKKRKREEGEVVKLLLQVTFKYHLATDIVKNWPLDQVEQGLRQLLLVGSSDHYDDSDDEKNSLVAASEWGTAMRHSAILGIQSARLETNRIIFDLVDLSTGRRQRGDSDFAKTKSTSPRLKQRAVLATRKTTTTTDSSSSRRLLAHDRTKQTPLQKTAGFLQALSVTDAQGNPRPGMVSKLRQCQKFVEIVSRLIESALSDDKGDKENISEISIVDMGCGRGYLTFSLHSYLVEKYANGRKVRSRGIDVRPKLVKEMSCIARSLGSQFDSLRFEQGTIEDFLLVDQERKEGLSSSRMSSSASTLDVLIALHACDTATDDALWSAIAKDTKIVVVAPCCHRQLRSQIDKHSSNGSKLVVGPTKHPMADVLRHNIYRERIAETVTDSMRALLLELAGYSVQVFEFVGGEHTSKNVMITAVKKQRNRIAAGAKNDDSSVLSEDLGDRLRALAAFNGVEEHKLATYMDQSLLDHGEQNNQSERKSSPRAACHL